MRLFITGASGLLGGKLASLAIAEGYEVHSIYNTHPATDGNQQRLDLTDKRAVRETIAEKTPDVVIHTAAITDVDFCEENPELATRVNVDATGFLAEACQEHGIYLIYLSTDYVFEGTRGHYNEKDRARPVNFYGHSKLLGEQRIMRHCEDFCIARTSWIYGWGREYRLNLATWLYQKLSEGEKTSMISDHYGSPTFNGRLAQMLLEAGKRRLQGIIHLAGATRTNRYEFAVRLARKFGFNEKLLTPIKSNFATWRAKRPVDSSLDVAKALEILNNKPASLEDGLEEFAREAHER